MDLAISLIDDTVQSLDLNLKGDHSFLCKAESLLKICNLPLLVNQGILLLSDKFHIIQRPLAARWVSLAQIQHSSHRALQLMLKQHEALAEIFFVLALEDHLRFPTELPQQAQEQILGVFERAEISLATEDDALIALPVHTSPDVRLPIIDDAVHRGRNTSCAGRCCIWSHPVPPPAGISGLR